MNSISCSINQCTDCQSVSDLLGEDLILPYPIPEPEVDVYKFIQDKVGDFVDANHNFPSHVFMHPVLIRATVVQFARDPSPIRPSTGYTHMCIVTSYGDVIVRPVDIKEKEDFILVGNENSYNEFIAEREILGDHL